MPNEIFDDLNAAIKNTPHIAFAYSYIYLITWIYRYSKHTVINNGIGNSTIKKILGYKPETRTVNYLITKGGLLDQIGYTTTVRDIPVGVEVDEGGVLEFTLLSALDDRTASIYTYGYSIEKTVRDNLPKNFTVKFPVKAFHRTKESEDDNYEDGTFFDVENTHNIPFEVFIFCMGKKDIECTGFYLYCYLKHRNDIYESGYDVSLQDLSDETGIAERSLDKYLGFLKSYKLIDFIHNQEFFAVGLKDEERKANTYITNDYEMFNDKPVPFQRINIISKKEYLKRLDEEKTVEFEKLFGNKADITIDELPY